MSAKNILILLKQKEIKQQKLRVAQLCASGYCPVKK